MKHKGKKEEQSKLEYVKLNEKIIELRDNILEEFEMLELVEDSISDVFNCDLNCVTCTSEEQGKCMQNFKKANIYWLRKIAQDEWILKDVVEKIDKIREYLIELMEKTKATIKSTKSEKFEEHKEQVKNKLKDNCGFYV